MRRSFGFIMLLVVVAVVLFLVGRAWQATSPATLLQGPVAIDSDEQVEIKHEAGIDRSQSLQNLQRKTDEHAEQLREALAATE